MSPEEFKRIRMSFGLSRSSFAAMIGYTGTQANRRDRIKKFENGKAQVPLYIARFVWLIEQHVLSMAPLGLPRVAICWPEWPGYDFISQPDPGHETGDA